MAIFNFTNFTKYNLEMEEIFNTSTWHQEDTNSNRNLAVEKSSPQISPEAFIFLVSLQLLLVIITFIFCCCRRFINIPWLTAIYEESLIPRLNLRPEKPSPALADDLPPSYSKANLEIPEENDELDDEDDVKAPPPSYLWAKRNSQDPSVFELELDDCCGPSGAQFCAPAIETGAQYSFYAPATATGAQCSFCSRGTLSSSPVARVKLRHQSEMSNLLSIDEEVGNNSEIDTVEEDTGLQMNIDNQDKQSGS